MELFSSVVGYEIGLGRNSLLFLYGEQERCKMFRKREQRVMNIVVKVS